MCSIITNSLSSEHVLYTMFPRYSSSPPDTACLVWLGGPDSRPRYSGQATSPLITESINSHLKLWLASKNLDLSIFKALVSWKPSLKVFHDSYPLQIDGLLPSKKATLARAHPCPDGGAGPGLDADTLASAALLQKMKSQYGSEKMMSALMSFLNTDPPGPPSIPIPGINDSQPQISAPISTPSSSNRGYYSSGSLTATYSSSPQPPDQPPPPSQYPATAPAPDQYSYQQAVAGQYAYPQPQYYQPTPTEAYYQQSINPLNPLFRTK